MQLRSSVLSVQGGIWDEVRVLGLLIPTAMLGVLVRLALTSLTSYSSPKLAPVLYSQALGCVVIGIGTGVKPTLEWMWVTLCTCRRPINLTSLIDLSVAINTGFCGSLTTFSTFMLDVFKAYTYITPSGYVARNAKGATFDVIGEVIATAGISIASVQLGLGIGRAIQGSIHLPESTSDTSKSHRARKITSTTAAIILAIAAYVIALALALSPSTASTRQWTYALLFAPAGAYTRHKLAQLANKGVLPWGTLTSNVLGCIFTSLGFGLVHLQGSAMSSAVRCNVLHALQDGLGGALSTVSSLAAELNTLGVSRKSTAYAALSVLLGQAACIVVAGSMKWSEMGFGEACGG
ncbi:hypothetical protein E3P99_02977 [Wallemia hederae]|uniref:Uncharacterized protein n=1 Tax=Wallemia hederae TaxID=1540922 RepID=A0A4T0FJI0_9BASI|nr:hypothetical protein E3P99_02977 [Wallemia hederae]